MWILEGGVLEDGASVDGITAVGVVASSVFAPPFDGSAFVSAVGDEDDTASGGAEVQEFLQKPPGDLVEAFLTKVPWATGTVGFQSVPRPSRKDRMHVSMLSYEKAPYTDKGKFVHEMQGCCCSL